MDGLLTPVSTTRRKDAPRPLLQEVPSTADASRHPSESATSPAGIPSSADEALEVLRNQPGYDSLITILRLVKEGGFERGKFDIANPSPIGAQIVHTLVTDIALNYWTLLREDDAGDQTASGKNRKIRGSATGLRLFLDCVRNLPGINAALLRLRALTREAQSEKKDVRRPDLVANLRITLDLLEAILEGTDRVHALWAAATREATNLAKRRPLAQEFLALLGSGRIVSYAAEAEDILKAIGDKRRGESASWIGDGAQYSTWLGRNIMKWATHDISSDDAKLCSDLLARSLRLGYAGQWVCVQFLLDVFLTSVRCRYQGYC